MGRMVSGWRQCWSDKKYWCSSIAHTFMEWGRAWWSHRNSILYGERKDKHNIMQIRLKAEAQAQAHVWMEAPSIETLIPIQREQWKRKLLKKEVNLDIAFWLEHNRTRRKIVQQGGGLEYSSDIDSTWGASSSKYQIPLKDIVKRQTHNNPGWTYGWRT